MAYNTVMAVLGIVVFSLGVYVNQNFAQSWKSLISMNAVWIAIFGGIIMICIAVLGCYAAKKNQKAYLCIYLVCVLVIVILLVAAAATTVDYSGALKRVNGIASSTITTRTDADLNNAVLSAFVKCCSGCPSGCNNVGKDAYYPGVATFCYNQGIPCDKAVACRSTGGTENPPQDNCFVYLSGDALVAPTHNIDQGLCSVMTGLKYGDLYLVGPAKTGGCGGGNIGQFKTNLEGYFTPKVYMVGVLLALIAVVQSTVIFVGVYVILFVSKKDLEMGDDEYKPRRERP
jgi:hypothetical protein